MWSPKARPQSYLSLPVTMALLGKRVSADIKNLKMRSSWVNKVGPKPNHKYLCKKKRHMRRETRRRPWEGGGRDGSDAAASQERPRAASCRQERGTEQTHPQSLREDQPSRHLDFRLLASRTARDFTSVVLSPPVVIICTAAPGN